MYDALYAWCRRETGEALKPERRRAAHPRDPGAFEPSSYGFGSVVIGVIAGRLPSSRAPRSESFLRRCSPERHSPRSRLHASETVLGRRRAYREPVRRRWASPARSSRSPTPLRHSSLAALTGTLSTDVVESGPFTSLEQAMLPAAAGGHDPTRLFGTYNTIATLAGSLGALRPPSRHYSTVSSSAGYSSTQPRPALALGMAFGLSNAVDGVSHSREPRRPLRRSRSARPPSLRAVRARLVRQAASSSRRSSPISS